MKCNNCGNDSSVPFAQVECLTTKHPLSVVRCPKCQLVFLDPRPDKTLGLKYFDDAYSSGKGFEKMAYYRDVAAIEERNNSRFEIVKGLQAPNKKILDFGSGQGHFVKIAKDNGWTAFGIEQSTSGREAAKQNLGVELNENLKSVRERDFSVITLWDVIEHLEDPRATLQQLSNYLHPTGYFIIETSNINSLNFLVNPQRWAYWNVDHLYYYSNYTLDTLLLGLNFFSVQSPKKARTVKKQGLLSKYLPLLNPLNFIKEVNKKIIAKQYKDAAKQSLMIKVYQKV
jgi:2-polyprenyl-3-methyl-5-hydroxy-6-metoxy-1,4-benzoquinol methylase